MATLLVCVYFIAIFCRLESGEGSRGELFTSESALRLYYAEQVSEGRSLPTVDYKAQHPEGLELFSRNPVVMEYITGYLYAFFTPPMPFVDFIRLVIPLIASLSIFAVYLMVREATGEKITALIVALFYAIALPAITRASGWEFLHETVALPCIFFQAYFFLKGVKSGKLHYGILSGLCIALALSSWKISQLYFLIFAVFAGTIFLFGKGWPNFYKSCAITVIFAVFAGLVVPFLRDGMFLTSFAMIIFYALYISLSLKRYETALKARSWYIFPVCLILLILILPQSSRNTHVYDLLRYKVQFLGQKPADPLLLPFGVRALWIDPFITPSMFELIYFFIPLILLGAASLWVASREIFRGRMVIGVKNSSHRKLAFWERFLTLIRGRDDLALIFILYNTAAFLAAYLFIRRLRVFFVYFLILLIGYLISAIIRRSGRSAWFGIIVLILALVVEFGKTFGFSTGLIFKPVLCAMEVTEPRSYFQATTLTQSQRELIDWIKDNTGEEEVILSHYHISPVIRAYADRAVNLTSLFESRPLREKVREYVFALFGTEEDLYRLCKKFKTDYVVCSIDTILDNSDNSWRYLANRQELNEEMVAYRMHFIPDGLKRFALLYENEYFRIYRVITADGEAIPERIFGTHPLYFRYDLFLRASGSTGRFKEYIENVYRVYLAGSRTLAAGQYGVSRRAYETALLMAPDFPEPYAGLGAIAENEGKGEEAIEYYQEYLRLTPDGLFVTEIRQRIDRIQ